MKRFSDTVKNMPVVENVIGACAGQLDRAIRQFGGDEACLIKPEDRILLDSCKPQENTKVQPAVNEEFRKVEPSGLTSQL